MQQRFHASTKLQLGKQVAALLLLASFSTLISAEPAVKIFQGELMDPAAADSWYSGAAVVRLEQSDGIDRTATTHTNGVCSLIPASAHCTSGRPAQIKALARTLGAGRYSAVQYSQHVLEYVYSNIDTEFRYGLSKGALGTLLDQSGTPFDQAHLMVELLREGGVTDASYQAGTIELNAAQFSAWAGITDASAACRLMADGGIPAVINGVTTATCSYSGAVSTVVLSHVWVSANGRSYDPSVKTHAFKSGVDLAAATGCNNCAATVQSTAIPAGSNYQGFNASANANYVQNVQTAALAGLLGGNSSSYARQLESYIKTNASTGLVEDIVGGTVIDEANVPEAAASLPYPSSVQRTWSGDIPDQYRSRLHVLFDNIDQWLFADEVDGHWLSLSGGLSTGQQAVHTRYSELHLYSSRISNDVHIFESDALVRSVRQNTDLSTAYATIGVDHPYYARDPGNAEYGSYMDDSNLGLTALVLDHGVNSLNGPYQFHPGVITSVWGWAGEGRVSHGSRQSNMTREDPYEIPTCVDNTNVYCWRTKPSEHLFGASWLAHANKAFRLVDGINQTITEHHHSVGISNQVNGFAPVDVPSNITVVAVLNSSADRQASTITSAMLLSAMEGGVAQQLNDSWGPYSTPAMFDFANQRAHVFYEVTGANVQSVLAATQNYSSFEQTVVQNYVSASGLNYQGIIPGNGDLGVYSEGNTNLVIPVAGLYLYSADQTRHAFINSTGEKGAVGAAAPFDKVLQTLQIQEAATRPKPYSLDLASGSVTVAPGPDIVTGQGDFPHSLPFQRYFSSAAATRIPSRWIPLEPNEPPQEVFDPKSTPDLPHGWTHQYEIKARIANDGMQGLGVDSALDATAVITGLHVLRALNIGTPSFHGRLTSVFVADWIADQLMGNAVVVTRPPSSATFVRLPSGAFNPPPASTETMVQTAGSRTQRLVGGMQFSYQGIQLELTTNDGGTITFSGGEHDYGDHLTIAPVYSNEFKPDRWTFPDGLVLSFEYASAESVNLDYSSDWFVLTAVTNSLGRRLNFDWTYTANYPASSDHWFLSVTDENGRGVRFGGDSNAPDNQANQVWFLAEDTLGFRTRYAMKYESSPSSGAIGQPAISKIFRPIDTTTPLVSFAYDGLNRVASVSDNGGSTMQFYPARVSTERFSRGESVDALGGTMTTYFDDQSRVLQTVNEIGRRTTNFYDGAGRLRRTVLHEGNATEYDYDARHNLIETRLEAKEGSGIADVVTRAEYPPSCVNPKTCNKPSWTEDAKGNRTDYTYKPTGQLETVLSPAVPVGNPATSVRPLTTYAYTNYTIGGNVVSLLTSKTDKVDGTRNRVTSFGYEPSNKYALRTVTAGAGTLNLVTTLTFDAIGNVYTIDGPRPGAADTTTYGFDTNRRLSRIDAPLGSVTEYEYYNDGSLRKTERQEIVNGTPVWRVEERTYWPTGELKTLRDPEGNITQYAYDANGRLDVVTDADGRKTKTDYDLAGQPLRTWKAWNSTAMSPIRYVEYTYTPNGKQATIKDANENVTEYKYDGLDRLVYTFLPEPDLGTSCALPAGASAPTCIGQQTYEKASYDENGNRTTLRTRKGEEIVYTYDALNRMSTKAAPSLPLVTYRYNLLGEPMSLSNPAGSGYPAHTVSYDYDDAGRKEYEESDGQRVSYLYDEAGNRTRTIWPGNSYYITYEYDVLNRMSKVWEGDVNNVLLAEYGYDTLSRRTSLRYAGSDANRVSYTYETSNRLDLLTHTMAGTTLELDYGYNGSGQIRSMLTTDAFYLGQPTTARHTGNAINRLNQYVASGNVTGTDSNGNPVVQGASGNFTIINIDDLSIVIPVAPGIPGKTRPDVAKDPGGNTVVHDSNGNLRRWTGPNGSRHLYTYDSENRLRTAAVSGGATATITYDYDPLGRRVAKTVNGLTTRYLLDGDEEIAEYDGSWNLQRRYVTGPAIDERIAMVESGGAKHYYHVNHQGSVVATTSDAGAIVQRLAYDEYGALSADSSTSGQVFRYTGRRFDEETGLYYYRARYYSPQLRRFLQTDPVGYEDDLNSYAYVGNDPANSTDPTGRNVLTKFVKQAIKNKGDLIEAAIDVGDTTITIFAPSSTPLDRLVAVVELVSPISVSDVKDGIKGVRALRAAMNKRFGGRKGSARTQGQLRAIRDRIVEKGGSITDGFGDAEARFPGKGGGVKGSNYSDGSALDTDGQPFQVQTVDTYANGWMTDAEIVAARNIARRARQPVVCIPKPKKGTCE